MKKFLLSLAVMALGLNLAKAEDPMASVEFVNGSEDYESVSAYNKEWRTNDGMFVFNAFNNNNRGWDFIAAGWKTAETVATISTAIAFTAPVGSIVLSIGDRLTSDQITAATLYVSDNGDFSDADVTTLSIPSTKNSDYVINVPNPAAYKYYRVAFDIPQQSSNGQALSITKVAIYNNGIEVGDDPEPTPTAVSVRSVKEMTALDSGTDVTVDCDLTVAFVNNYNVYVCDTFGDFIQIYGSNSYKVNDVIPAGWDAQYVLYNSTTPELTPSSTLPASTEQSVFTPKSVAAADITTDLVNSVILVENVVLDEASPSTKSNFTGKVGDVELSFRNNYTLESVEAGTYNITVLVTIYSGSTSLYVINYAAADSSVAELEADENAEAVYYNLQGVKVAEPENGLYIKVQGNKATKVLVRK